MKILPLKFLFSFFNLLFKVRLVQSKKDRIWFRNTWKKIWVEEEYAHNKNIEEIQRHYDVFLPYSDDYLLKFLGIPIGTMRIIWENEEVRLPVENDFQLYRTYENGAIEITLLTLNKRWRGLGHFPTFLLWKKAYQEARKKGFDNIVMAADWRLFKLLTRIFPFQQIGEERFYEGSLTIPSILNLRDAEKSLIKKDFQLFTFFTSN